MVCLPNRGLRRRLHTERGKNKSKNTRDVNAKGCSSSSLPCFRRSLIKDFFRVSVKTLREGCESAVTLEIAVVARTTSLFNIEKTIGVVTFGRLTVKKPHLEYIHTYAREYTNI